jgi:hypothetical protein
LIYYTIQHSHILTAKKDTRSAEDGLNIHQIFLDVASENMACHTNSPAEFCKHSCAVKTRRGKTVKEDLLKIIVNGGRTKQHIIGLVKINKSLLKLIICPHINYF